MASLADETTKLLLQKCNYAKGHEKTFIDEEASLGSKGKDVEMPEGWKHPLCILTVATLACCATHIAMISGPVYESGNLRMSITYISCCCALLLFQRSLLSCIRYAAMRQILGLDHATIMEFVFEASPGNLDVLFQKTNKNTLRALDGVIRKSYHITIWFELCRLHIHLHSNQAVFNLVSISISFFNIMMPLMLANSESIVAFGWWGASVRVWDGHSKRSNSLLTAVTGSYLALLALWIANNFIIMPVLPPAVWGPLPYTLITIPVLVGDAVAELVGASFGKHTFQVSGLGEINRKSLEGCMAFVLSTAACLFYTLHSAGVRLPKAYFTAFVMSVTTMIAETYSFRGTDNVFIILVGGATLAVCAKAFWPVQILSDMTYGGFLQLSGQLVFEIFRPELMA